MTSNAADESVADFVSEQDLLVVCQGQLKVAEGELEHLRSALVSARRIGAAIGIIMGTRRITDDDAFEVLSDASQAQNRKLREIAEDVIRTGTVEERAQAADQATSTRGPRARTASTVSGGACPSVMKVSTWSMRASSVDPWRPNFSPVASTTSEAACFSIV